MGSLIRFLATASLILGPAGSVWAQKPKNAKDDVNQIGSRKVANCVNFYSLEKEMALGKQLANEVQRQAKVVDDPLITEKVNRIGQNLVRNSDAQVPFTIKVIDSDVVNAMALPGGFFYVNSGLILAADEEAEVAGVMAQEVCTCRADDDVERAEQLMAERQIHRLPVVGDDGSLIGILSLADVARQTRPTSSRRDDPVSQLATTVSAISEPHRTNAGGSRAH